MSQPRSCISHCMVMRFRNTTHKTCVTPSARLCSKLGSLDERHFARGGTSRVTCTNFRPFVLGVIPSGNFRREKDAKTTYRISNWKSQTATCFLWKAAVIRLHFRAIPVRTCSTVWRCKLNLLWRISGNIWKYDELCKLSMSSLFSVVWEISSVSKFP